MCKLNGVLSIVSRLRGLMICQGQFFFFFDKPSTMAHHQGQSSLASIYWDSLFKELEPMLNIHSSTAFLTVALTAFTYWQSYQLCTALYGCWSGCHYHRKRCENSTSFTGSISISRSLRPL